MARGAYYARERTRHDAARRVHLAYREAKALTRALADAYGFRVRFRRIRRGRALGHCRQVGPRSFRIGYRPWRPRGAPHDVVTLLTVIHEFAHAVDFDVRPRARVRHGPAHALHVDRLAVEASTWLTRLHRSAA